MNFVQYTIFVPATKIFFLPRCKIMLGLKHLSKGLFDKYLRRLKKLKELLIILIKHFLTQKV